MQRIEAHPIDELAGRSMSQMARSQRLPASRLPASSNRPSARAASRVTAAMHSSTVRRNRVAPMFMVSNSEVSGEEPGLQSVEIAMGTP